jgi:hypothetical protein
MRLRKTLAYGLGNADGPEKGREVEKPNQIKRLAYAFTLALPLIAACGVRTVSAREGLTSAVASSIIAPRPAREAKAPPCASDIGGILQPGERVTGTVCRFGRDYVMTTTSLLMIRRQAEEMTFDPISLRMRVTRTDMRDILSQGIADWEPSEDSVFVLTRADKLLTRLPNEGMGDTVPVYEMPFETSMLGSDSMVYHSGFLFIAPQGANVLVFSFSGESTGQERLNLRSELPDAGFFMREGRLIFGRSGVEETEIRVDGPEIKSIRLIKRQL